LYTWFSIVHIVSIAGARGELVSASIEALRRELFDVVLSTLIYHGKKRAWNTTALETATADMAFREDKKGGGSSLFGRCWKFTLCMTAAATAKEPQSASAVAEAVQRDLQARWEAGEASVRTDGKGNLIVEAANLRAMQAFEQLKLNECVRRETG
jgi:hypothetical protein